MRDWATVSDRSPDVSSEYARRTHILSTLRQAATMAGWQVRMNASNVGELESEPGQIEIVVIDSDDEARSRAGVGALACRCSPEKLREFRVEHSGQERRPEPDVIIASFARVGDLTAMNDEDWLMLGDAEQEDPDTPIVTDLDPPPVGSESVRFLDSPPRLFVVDGAVCILVTALTSGGDSPQKLDQAVGEVIGGANNSYPYQRQVPGRWSAFSTDDGLVAGKTFECFRPNTETQDFVRAEDPTSLRLAITLEAEGADPYTEEFPIKPETVQAVLELASASE